MNLVLVAGNNRQQPSSNDDSRAFSLEPQAWSIGGTIAAALVRFGIVAETMAANTADKPQRPSLALT